MENQENVKKKRTWKPRPVMPKFMGVVTSWDKYKKYGFIRCYEDGESYFCHISQFKDDVPERGMVVEFAIYTNKETGKQCCSNCLVVEVPERHRRR